MIGGYFDGHPWNAEVPLKVEDHESAMTRHLGETWKVADEIYQFRDFSRSGMRVLLSLDTSSVDMKKDGIKRTDGDFANAWFKLHGKGKVFYTASVIAPRCGRAPSSSSTSPAASSGHSASTRPRGRSG